jgi:hypothetical protein
MSEQVSRQKLNVRVRRGLRTILNTPEFQSIFTDVKDVDGWDRKRLTDANAALRLPHLKSETLDAQQPITDRRKLHP